MGLEVILLGSIIVEKNKGKIIKSMFENEWLRVCLGIYYNITFEKKIILLMDQDFYF